MTAVSVEIFELNSNIDLNTVENTARGYSTSDSNSNLNNNLRTRTEDVRRWTNPDGLALKLIFERAVKMSSWNEQHTWRRIRENQSVVISEDIRGGGFLMIGGKDGRDTAISRLMDLLGVGYDDYEKVDIPTSGIENIVSQDAQSETTVAARNIGPHTDSGSAAGDVGQSRIAQDVEGGNITWKQFSSRQFGGQTIGVGTSSIVTYGDGWSDQDRLNYVINIVMPNI